MTEQRRNIIVPIPIESYSNTVRQGATGTRTSSGGGIGFGK